MKKLMLLTSACLLSAGGIANAQTINDARAADNPGRFARVQTAVPVLDRAKQFNKAEGGVVGVFRVLPEATAAVGFVDNIYATSSNEVSDTVGLLREQVTVQSLWSRHALGGFVNAQQSRYQDRDTENANQWTAGLSGRVDLGVDGNITGSYSHGDLQEPRTSQASPTIAGEPIQFTLDTATIAAVRSVNRFQLSGVYTRREYDYSDVNAGALGLIDQQFRDVTASTLRGRVDYAISPDTSLFVELSRTDRDYRTIATGGFNRDGTSTLALAGANFSLSSLVRGEVGVGYLKSDHDDASRRDVDGLGGRAEIEYYPTELLTLTVSGSRAFQDTGIREASGNINSQVEGRADYEIRRNLIASGRLGYSRDEYQDIDREDKRWLVGLGLSYYFHRAASLDFNYDLIDQDSEGAPTTTGRDFRVGRTTIGVTYRY